MIRYLNWRKSSLSTNFIGESAREVLKCYEELACKFNTVSQLCLCLFSGTDYKTLDVNLPSNFSGTGFDFTLSHVVELKSKLESN